MVARTPPKLRKMVAPLNPTLLRETVNKVDKCMARLQELQCTVTGGTKVISGVSLSPRSTRGYLKTSLRCKQESLRIKNANPRKSPPGKLPIINTEEWRRMSLPAMLVGETIGEILHASKFARQIVSAVASKTNNNKPNSDDPKTPVTQRKRQNQKPSNPENSELRARRKKEKQITFQSIRSESSTPTLQRARSRINFKVSPLHQRENGGTRFSANRVSPRNRPWARKTVLFPNPLFHSSPTSHHHKFCKTKSPVITRKNPQTTPHKFHVKIRSPPPISISPTKVSTAAKLCRSFSPSRLANRLVSMSPLKGRKSSVRKSDGMNMMKMMSGLKQRPTSTPMQFSARRI
uniref:Putative microtubule-binding protein TANGLED n=1 Tax=Davidia involucrata TaxID=16924 RepID=A0A5B7BCA4_DAVIN